MFFLTLIGRFLDPTDPATYNLPEGYVYSEEGVGYAGVAQSWGRFFWRRGGIEWADWQTAKNECEQEGAELPVPRDSSQIYFIFMNACGPANSTEPNTSNKGCYGSIWLGINDEENEGTYVDNAGVPINYSYWLTDNPNRCDNNNHSYGYDCEALDASFMYGRHHSGATLRWGKARTTEQRNNFMCIKFLDP